MLWEFLRSRATAASAVRRVGFRKGQFATEKFLRELMAEAKKSLVRDGLEKSKPQN
uniref:Uncharacterized protein n=1 Tax=Rhizobium rhizogenes TaxID=359 RepID=A0A7S5DRT3_RHIRH|nr:hypothetical protein pC6.5b_347 [Rhizobium rhizogenes]